MVVLRGTAVPVGLEVIATLVALLILITEPACVAMLEGRLSTLDFDEGGFKPLSVEPSSIDSRCAGADVAVVRIEVFSSPKGSAASRVSSASLTTSSGPKDVEARGDLPGDFGVYAGGPSDEPPLELRESALITSALAAPTT